MTQAQTKTKPDFFDEKHREAVRKAFRAGRRTVTLDGVKFNIESGQGAGKKFILVLPVNGMLPMAQIEKERFGSSKLSAKDGWPVPGKKRRNKSK